MNWGIRILVQHIKLRCIGLSFAIAQGNIAEVAQAIQRLTRQAYLAAPSNLQNFFDT